LRKGGPCRQAGSRLVELADAVLVRLADAQSTVPSAEGELLGVLIVECVCDGVMCVDGVVVMVCGGVCDGLELGKAEHCTLSPVDQ
jgi:hypothetical protein